MKTITRKDTHISLYLLDDATAVTIDDQHTTVGNPVQFIISDCSTADAVLYEGITAPADWQAWRYFYDGASWTLNPDWVDPSSVTK